MTLPPVLEIPLIPELDQFGDQILVVQSFDIPERGALGIFDSGASAVTFSGQDQAFFDMSGYGTIPIKVPGGALAEGIGGAIVGDVSEPGLIVSDGMASFNLTFDEWGFPVFDIALRPSALETPGIQAFVGTEQSPLLPTITGTPALNPSPKYENGAAAWVRMLGAELDFSDLIPGMEGLVIPFPDLEYAHPGMVLQPDPQYGEVFDTVTFPLIPFGNDNSANPGQLITESLLWLIPEVYAYDASGSTGATDFLFDTGAQLSVISTDMALELGLDLDQPETSIDVQGVAGVMTVPGYTLDFLDFTRDDGGILRYANVPVYVLDVAPGIDGIFGMNLMNVASQFVFDPHHPDGPQVSVSYFSDPDRGGMIIDDELLQGLEAIFNLAGLNALGGSLAGGGSGIPGIGISKYNPTTTLTTTPAPVSFGQSWSVTAAIGFPAGADAPTGTVEFRNGTTVLATVPVDSQGQATWSFAGAAWDAGVHAITAVYSGDSRYHASAGAAELTIQQAASTLSVASDRTIASVGQPVRITGSLAFPAGFASAGRTIKLVVDGVETATAVTTSSGSYEFLVPGLALGSHEIRTRFAGESNFAAVTSAPVQVLVAPAAPPTLAVDIPTSAVFGQSLQLSASIGQAYAAAYEGVPVSFFGNGVLLGSAPFAGGIAKLPYQAGAVGSVSITASVPAVGSYPALSPSQPVVLVVNKASVSITWSVVNGAGGMTDWIITVRADALGAGTPTGFIRIASRASRSTARVIQLVDGRALFRFRGQGNAPLSITYMGDSRFDGFRVIV